MSQAIQNREADFGFGVTVGLEFMRSNSNLSSKGRDRFGVLRTRNRNIGRHGFDKIDRQGLDVTAFLFLKVVLGRIYDVPQKHGYSHGADAAGNGRDLGRNLDRRFEVDVTDQSLPGFLGLIGDEVCANINHHNAGLELFASDEFRLPNGRDQNVGTLEDGIEVLGFRVAYGHRGVGALQQIADWTSDNVASTENNRFLAHRVHPTYSQKFHDTLWRARHKQGTAAALREFANVGCAESVHVLFIRHC